MAKPPRPDCTPGRAEAPARTGLAPRSPRIVLIGASTGGVDALSHVLWNYPEDCPPTVIVQHTGQSFGVSLAKLLAQRCPAEVVLATSGMDLSPGRVCLVAGTPGHAVLTGPGCRRIDLVDDAPVNGHCPSIDRLFQSAIPIAPQVEAALLTGMGSDGAMGLLALRNAGAGTVSQDEASSVVYGMPRVAWEVGAADRQLPIDRIGPALLTAAQGAMT